MDAMASPGRLFGLREWRPRRNHPIAVPPLRSGVIASFQEVCDMGGERCQAFPKCLFACRAALRIKPPRPQIRAAGTSRFFITPQHDSNFFMIELNSMRLAPFALPTLQAAMVSVGGPPPCTSPRKAMTLSSSTTSADGTSTTSLAAPPSLPLNLLRLALRHGRR